MKRVLIVSFLVLLLIALAGCAPGVNEFAGRARPGSESGEPAGFWMGLWHGFASPVMFIISLFNRSVEVYEVYNNGGWYTFGFMLGVSIIFGGGSGGAASGRRRRR